jgi:hypothetical protein
VAVKKSNERELRGTVVSMEMANAEGWLSKNGSKWKTMPEQMLMYRAATFFCRTYCPEVLAGVKTQDELMDIEIIPSNNKVINDINSAVSQENEYAEHEEIEDEEEF